MQQSGALQGFVSETEPSPEDTASLPCEAGILLVDPLVDSPWSGTGRTATGGWSMARPLPHELNPFGGPVGRPCSGRIGPRYDCV